MTQIDKLQPISRIHDTENTAAVKNTTDGMFGSVFQSAIDNVKQTEAQKNEAEYLLATGQLDNPAELTIAATKNQIAVELLVQLRNKALEAYNSLKNINA